MVFHLTIGITSEAFFTDMVRYREDMMRIDEAPIIVEQWFNASVDAVWKAITDADEMRQWFFDNISAFEPKVGFVTQFPVTNEGRVFPHRWKVIEATPPEKIAYDWQYDNYPGIGVVTFELSREDDGTRLKLTYTVLEDFSDDIPEFERESGRAGGILFKRV
jgi:uncharacterized protein YndB with AHSA1/START domain